MADENNVKMNQIRIGKPYIVETSSNINELAARLCADVEMINPNTGVFESRTLYYEVERQYKNALCEERLDAFVTGLLTSAMENGLDIYCEGAVSERLFYQLTTHFIPILSKNNPSRCRPIKLFAPTSSIPIPNAHAVSTGCSGGVDSFTTICTHTNICETFRLTHLLFASHGTLDFREERIEAYYLRELPTVRAIGDAFNLETIGVFSNLHTFYKFPYKGFNTIFFTTHVSFVFALQNLFAVYYESSGDPLREFNIQLDKAHGSDGSIFDTLSCGSLCTENLSFYSTNADLDRIEKLSIVANNKTAQDYLTVCVTDVMGGDKGHRRNCGRCDKCLRTIVQLYVLKELDKFRNVFDIDDFNNHKHKRIAEMLSISKPVYIKQARWAAKENNVKLGFRTYLWKYLFYKPKKIAYFAPKDNVIARKIYFKLNLDYKINGFRTPKNAHKDIGGGSVK